MGDRIRKWIAVLLAGSILAMIHLVPAGVAVFVRGNIENIEILGEKETSLQQTLHARACVLMDADSGRILAGKDADTAYPMASTTKILTCILALEQGNPDDWVEVSEKAASMPDVQLNMRAGERYRLSDLLYSLMLESHNDSAVAVAEHIGGSVEEFAEKMNRKAWEIGCKNVCFVTPNGLDVADADGNEHSASAADMARIMRYCAFQSPCRETFLEITRTASRTIQDEYDIFDREKTFPEVEVRRGVKGTTALTLNLPSEKQTFLMLLRADEKPDIRYEYPTELEAPVHEGQEVGQASYYINDEQVAAYPIYAAETVEKIDYGWCLRRCVTYFEREFQSMWQTWGV